MAVSTGSCRMLINETDEYHLSPGYLLVIPGGNGLRRFVDEHACFLGIEISPDFFQDIPPLPETEPLLDVLTCWNVKVRGEERITIEPPLPSCLVYDPELFHSFLNLFEEYLTLYRQPHLLRDIQRYTYGQLLAQFMLRILLHEKNSMEVDSTTKRVLEIKTWIDRHLFESLAIPYLAERVGLTPSWFSTVFHQVVGIPPKSYIVSQRIQYAATLLLDTDLSIIDIMHHVGFNDLGYFNRVFKQHMHDSPGLYRKKIQKGQ